jgi:chromate reductase, NAD(P)H dehydrogenase (quinone)
MPPVRILLVSGSSRGGSTNAAVLRTAAAVAGEGVQTVIYPGIGELPLFNPDDDRQGVPVDPRVAEMRREVEASDAVLFCTPEYAGALPAALKNLLEGTIGDAGTYRKPVAWINAAARPRPRAPPTPTTRCAPFSATPAPTSSRAPAPASRSSDLSSAPTA